MRVGAMLVVILCACGPKSSPGQSESVSGSEVGSRDSDSDSEFGSRESELGSRAPESESTPPPAPAPDPHPVVAGFDRELRAWMNDEGVQALEGVELTGTAHGDTEGLTGLIRHVLFRELAGPAILGLDLAEVRRYGEDIRAMPESPFGTDIGHPLEHGADAHMNLDGMGNVVGDLQGQCRSSSSGEREADPCEERFAPVWAALKLARTAYLPIDLETMGFQDRGIPLGDGEWDRAPPTPLRELLAIAERAGLERSTIVEVTIQLLRDLVALARD